MKDVSDRKALDRRTLLALGGVGAIVAVAPAAAQTSDATPINMLKPDDFEDQSAAFQAMLDAASSRDEQVTLPAGTFRVANIRLPFKTRIAGIRGATRLRFAGGEWFLRAENCERVTLSDLVFDGDHQPQAPEVEALVDLRRPGTVSITDCAILDSPRSALILDEASGQVARCTLTGAIDFALWAIQSNGLTIADNEVRDCGDGGILVHRRETGPDRTIVRNNRVSRIAARSGGTGQFGNGINLFRAGDVQVTGNIIEDCAFTAIRANSSSGAIITGNSCLRSGETGLYAEFQFEGAIIANNLIDGAANGISVVNFNEGGRLATVSGNIVRNLKTTAPYQADPPGFGTGIAVEAETVVSGNVIEAAPLYGVHIGWGEYMRNVTATGNVIRDCATGIAVTVVEGTGPAIITDNVISGAKNGAIVGYRWAEAATGDLTQEPANQPGLLIERNQAT